MAQWWERSSSPTVARVRFRALASHVGWVCRWYLSLLWGFSPRPPVFLLPQTLIFQFQFRLGNSGQAAPSRAMSISMSNLFPRTVYFTRIFICSPFLCNSSDKSITSMISFNRGGEWSTIPLADEQCKNVKREVFHEHLVYNNAIGWYGSLFSYVLVNN